MVYAAAGPQVCLCLCKFGYASAIFFFVCVCLHVFQGNMGGIQGKAFDGSVPHEHNHVAAVRRKFDRHEQRGREILDKERAMRQERLARRLQRRLVDAGPIKINATKRRKAAKRREAVAEVHCGQLGIERQICIVSVSR